MEFAPDAGQLTAAVPTARLPDRAPQGTTVRVPRRCRAGSRSAAVRGWVLALPGDTAFRLEDMPVGLRGDAPRVLYDMTREYVEIRRVFNGFYWRGRNPREGGTFPDYGHIAIAYGGPGSGFAGASAVNRLGWSTQVPAKARVAIVGRAPETRHSSIVFVSRANAVRRELTWAEVTLLEAVRSAELAEPAVTDWEEDFDYRHLAWSHAIDAVVDGRSLDRLGQGAILRPSAIRRAAAGERRPGPRFLERINQITAQLPDLLHHPDRTERVRLVAQRESVLNEAGPASDSNAAHGVPESNDLG